MGFGLGYVGFLSLVLLLWVVMLAVLWAVCLFADYFVCVFRLIFWLIYFVLCCFGVVVWFAVLVGGFGVIGGFNIFVLRAGLGIYLASWVLCVVVVWVLGFVS